MTEASRINPVKATTSIELGTRIYNQNCISCHGSNSTGPNIGSNKLMPRPANLHILSKTHTDGELAYKIRTGHNTMPGRGDSPGENEIWSLVDYIRSMDQHSN